MADPLSITASLIAILQISGGVIQTSYNFLHSIKEERNDIRRIIDELNNLNSVLLALYDLTRSKNAIGDVRLLNLEKLLNSSDGPLQKCQTELQFLHERLSEPVTGLKGIGKTLVWPLKEKETQKTLDIIRAQKGTCDLALNINNAALSLAIHDDVKALGESLATVKIEGLNKKLIDWYSTVDPYSNYLAAREKREPTTGNWFIGSAEFVSWLTTPKSFLWLHGIPGCGKTVLSSTIIEKVLKDYENKPQIAIAYFYFDFAESKKQSIKSCLSSLTAQLCRQRTNIPYDVQFLYSRHMSSATRATSPLVADLLVAFSAATEGLEVWLIFDALDECAERDLLMDVLTTISSGTCGNIKILATSRSERDIEVAIMPLSKHNVRIQDAKIEADIRLFVSNTIAREWKMKRWPTRVKVEVESALVQGSKGMFRWAKCQLDVLRSCSTAIDVTKALSALPPTLDETYERILLDIDQDEREKAHIALQWLIFSARPLQLQELAEAVVVNPKSNSFSQEERLFDLHDIVSICRSLVSLSDDTSEVRLAHFSVQEYLISERIRDGPVSFFSVVSVSAHTLMAEVCLTYILLFDTPYSLSAESLTEWPLLDYACRHWFHHAKKLVDQPDRCKANILAEKLFTPDQTFCFYNWLRIFEPDGSWIDFDPYKNPSSFATPLYYASYCGLLAVAKTLIERGADVAARGGMLTAPLCAATFTDSTDIVRLLIQSKAEVNIIDGRGSTPLHHSCWNSNAELVRLLLEAGADVKAKDLPGGCPIHLVSYNGHIPTLQALLEYGAEVDARAWFEEGNLTVEPGSNIEAQWCIGRTPLMEAAWNGQEEMVQFLLNLGADINAVDGHGMTALIRAARCGHDKVFKILLSRGADATIKDRKGWTANDWLSAKLFESN